MKKTASPNALRRPKSTGPSGGSAHDWREGTIVRLRQLIRDADPDSVEQQKWKKPSNPKGVPVWYHDGILCHVVALKGRVRLTFAKGAQLDDQRGLYNACLEGNSMRAIDFYETDRLDDAAIKSLIRAAVRLNESSVRR